MQCFFLIFSLLTTSLISTESYPLLLLVSFDGFRWDYPQIHGPLPNFRRLEQRGVHARQMISTFNTATFPNHYSLVTGLYEEVHGIISNHMFDPKTNLTFEPPQQLKNANWWPYPAIWFVNEQRKGARSGVASWPQEEIRISKYQEYNRSRSFEDIVDQILLWFNDSVEPINFGAVYFHEPDLTGHRTGPYSTNMRTIVRQCDELLGYLLDQIDRNQKLRDQLHLIVTSDHGMEQINGTKNPLYIDKYIDGKKVKAYGIPSAMNIFVQSPNDIETVMRNLSTIPHAKVYRREDIPNRYHYKNNERIGDLLLLFEPGYEIVYDPAHGGKRRDYTLVHGNHGYDNQLESMKGIFYASGPQFKRNFTLDNGSALYNIDVFGLMCLILDVEKCPSSNGSLANVQPFLKSRTSVINRVIYSIALIAIVLSVIIGIIWSVMSFRGYRNDGLGPNVQHNRYHFSDINNPKLVSAVENEPA